MSGLINSGAAGSQSGGVFVLSGQASSTETNLEGTEGAGEAVEFSEVLDQQAANAKASTDATAGNVDGEQLDESVEQLEIELGLEDVSGEVGGNPLPNTILLSGEALPQGLKDKVTALTSELEDVSEVLEEELAVDADVSALSSDADAGSDAETEADTLLSSVTIDEKDKDSEVVDDETGFERVVGQELSSDVKTTDDEVLPEDVQDQSEAASYGIASTSSVDDTAESKNGKLVGAEGDSKNALNGNGSNMTAKVSELSKQSADSQFGQGAGKGAELDAALEAGKADTDTDVEMDAEFERYLNQQRSLVGRSEPARTQAPSTAFSNLTGQPMQTGVEVPVGTKEWGPAVGERIVWLAGEGIQTAEIHVTPPELGPLSVKINVQNDSTQLVFSSNHSQVRDALEQQIPRLREMFEEQGLNLTDVDVSDQSLAEGSESGDEFDDDNGSGASANDELAEEEQADVSHLVTQRSVGLVDAYV